MDIPVYMLAGFLDSGKTSFINDILRDGFCLEDPTLLLCCEEGEVEYEPDLLENVTVVNVEAETDLTREFLEDCQRKYRPRQVIVEYNGMWSIRRFYSEVLPNNWILYQVMTMVEASTFDAYARNLGQVMMEKISVADMIIFNRCTEADRASLRSRNLKMVNRRANIYLENVDGSSEDYMDENMCPFDLSSDVLNLPDDEYGIWYVDVMDHPQRYEGKKIHMKAIVAHLPKYPGDCILGRFAMTCCAADVSFLGVVCRGGLKEYKNRSWVEVEAHIALERHAAYEDKGPVLYLDSVKPAEKPAEELITF